MGFEPERNLIGTWFEPVQNTQNILIKCTIFKICSNFFD